MKAKNTTKPHTTSEAHVSAGKTKQSGSLQRLIALFVALLVAAAGLYTLLASKAAVTTPTLFISPASQTITNGSNVVISVTEDSATTSINTVQSVVTYDATKFSFVSITPGSAFSGAFPNSNVSGSITFAAGSTSPLTGLQTVATITLKAIGNGTSPITLAPVCAAGDYSSTCSAVYSTAAGAPNVLTTLVNGSYTVDPIRPTVPANLRSTGTTTTSVSLAWDPSTDVGGPGLASYKLYRNGGATAIATIPAGTTVYTDTGRSAGTAYSYTIQAVDTAGVTSAMSSAISVTTVALPTTPTNLRSTSTTASTIALAWNASTDVGGPGLAGYKLYRNSTLIASPTGTTYTDTGLTPGVNYSYTIQAVDTAGNTSATSSAVSIATAAAPTVPTNVQASSTTTNSISLSWTASTAAGGVGGYKLYRNSTLIASPTGTTYTDTGLSPGTAYSYTIQAYDTVTPPNYSAMSAPMSLSTKAVTADLDGDNLVTAHDLSLLLSKYNTTYPDYDIDGVAPITGHDLSLLLAKFNGAP